MRVYEVILHESAWAVLVPIDSVAARSNTPTSKFVVVTLAPSTAGVYPKAT